MSKDFEHIYHLDFTYLLILGNIPYTPNKIHLQATSMFCNLSSLSLCLGPYQGWTLLEVNENKVFFAKLKALFKARIHGAQSVKKRNEVRLSDKC